MTEKKTITIDKGSQLYHVDVELGNADSIPNCTIGITLHDKKGVANADSIRGWFPILGADRRLGNRNSRGDRTRRFIAIP